MLVERIEKKVEKEIMRTGAMGTEGVVVFLSLSEEEKQEALELHQSDFSLKGNWFWNIQDNDIEVTFEEKEELKTMDFYLAGIETIEVGRKYYLGQLTDGTDSNLEEIIESGCIALGDAVIDFKVRRQADDLLETVVEVTDIR